MTFWNSKTATHYSFNDNQRTTWRPLSPQHLAVPAVCVTINHLDKGNLRNARHLQLWRTQLESTANCRKDCAELSRKQLHLKRWRLGVAEEHCRGRAATQVLLSTMIQQSYAWSPFFAFFSKWTDANQISLVCTTPGKMMLSYERKLDRKIIIPQLLHRENAFLSFSKCAKS